MALQIAVFTAQKPTGYVKKVFLYEQLTKALLAELASGLYVAGERFLSKRELCHRWKISDPTAQSALRWLAEQKLIEARPRSGCYVRPGSQKHALLLLHRVRTPKLAPQPGWESKRFALRNALETPTHQHTVAVIVAALPAAPAHSYHLSKDSLLGSWECTDAIFEAAKRAQVALEFFLDNGEAERRRLIANQILDLKPSGVIAFRRLASYVPLQPMLSVLVEAHLPVVTLFDDCEGLNLHSINLNNVAIGYDVARRFLKHRHRRMAVLIPENSGDYFGDRAVGCEQAWREANLPREDLQVLSLSLKRPSGAVLRKLLATDSRPTAIFSTTATFLPVLLGVLRKLRLSVPKDVSLIMTAGVVRTPEMTRAVDTILINFPKLGKLAFDTLMNLLAGKAVERTTFVGVTYAAAGSVARPV